MNDRNTLPGNAFCRVEMFGSLRVTVGGQDRGRARTQKASWLLALLALRRGEVFTRDRLIDLFWPDLDLDAGRDNLSTTLSLVRRVLGEAAGALHADRSNVRMDAEAVVTDVSECDALLRRADSADTAARASLLQAALAGMRGELLPDCYEDWAQGERRRWQERRANALLDWAEVLETEGRADEALNACDRAIEADPHLEQAYRTRMRVLARQGRATAALEVYRDLERRLREEMNIAPSAATRELAERLRLEPDAYRRPPTVPAPVQPHDAPSPQPERANPSVSLPPQFTRFFGRDREVEQLLHLLAGGQDAVAAEKVPEFRLPRADFGAPARLVTILGPGGAGKTRLAIVTAQQAAVSFPGGVWFVSLAELPDPRLIPTAIARTLGLTPLSTADPLEQVLLTLGRRRCLLVLDNFEHLLRGEPAGHKGDYGLPLGVRAVRLLLERAPGLCCLVTSRQPLGLQGEQEFPLPPLPTPERGVGRWALGAKDLTVSAALRSLPADPLITQRPTPNASHQIVNAQRPTPDALLAVPSVALYVERARAVLPDFVLTAANADAVATLCRLLEGMPLALEMAAAWVRTLPPARMLEHLEGNVTRLSSRRRDLPARQRSLSATIEWSYELLEPGLRALFSRLSVFRGGWTHESAEQVCGEGVGYRGIEVLGTGSASHIEERATSVSPQHPDTSIPDTQYPDLLDSLTDLVDKSLVIYEDAEPEGRYRMLEPLREFAADRLTESGERPAFVRRHIAFVYNLALEAGRGRQGHSDSGALARLLRETDNLRAALDGCRELEDVELELRLAGSLRVFWSASGLIAEGRRQLQEALMHPGAQEPTVARSLALRTMGYLAQLQNDRTMARSCFEQALEILRARDDQAGVPAVLGHLAWLSREEHRDKEAHSLLTEALAGYRRLGHQEGIAQCLGNLGVLALDRNDTVTARAHLEEAISLCRQQENIYHLAAYLGMLGNLETTEGRLAAASASLEEALVIQRSLQDRSGIACTLLPLGFLRRKQGDEVAAEAHLRECLTLSREMNVPSLILDTLWALAELCQRRHPKIAALLMAAVNAQRAALNLPSEPNGHNDDPLPTGLKSSLEPAEYEAACREGAELTLDQATDLALAL